jgi:hypothetical protein
MQGNPEDLKGRGYVETSHPDASAAGHRTFVNPSTGDKFATTKEHLEPPGSEGEDHYHRYNPNSTGKGADLPQRVIRRNTLLQRQIAEHTVLNSLVSTHTQ